MHQAEENLIDFQLWINISTTPLLSEQTKYFQSNNKFTLSYWRVSIRIKISFLLYFICFHRFYAIHTHSSIWIQIYCICIMTKKNPFKEYCLHILSFERIFKKQKMSHSAFTMLYDCEVFWTDILNEFL